ncbi:MAG: acyl-CoA carboxylase subunit beta [Fimbriimonadaceae bacterium]|nr:acyl-CoA carboxylase subunit beta [Fimbriimonadaceae bacterium]
MANQDKLDQLREKRAALQLGGGQARIDKQHAAGRLTARERIGHLLDPDSFEEQGLFAEHRCTQFGMAGKEAPADGVVTGLGSVDGRPIHLASQDFTVFGGSAGEVHSMKIVDAMENSLKTGTPFVFINDSGGARVQEGIDSLAGYARVFYANTMLSGVVPQISLICGPCAGGAAYSPALTDFIIQTRQAQMFITGPSVIKQVTGEDVSAEQLGGAEAQMHYSGVVHFVAENDKEAIDICRSLLSFLPPNNVMDPPIKEGEYRLDPVMALNDVIPDDPRKPYDVKDVIDLLVDEAEFLEIHENYATNIVVGFARIAGRPIGIVANQPLNLAGVLDINSSDKASRFIRFCNAFNFPIVTLVDTPGFLPGVEQEYGGIIRHGAKMLFAYSAATVPKISVIMRKAYGGAYVAMSAKDLKTDRAFAWPTAEIAVMGAEGAAEIVFKREIETAEDKAATRAELIKRYRDHFSNPYVAASKRMVDDVIEPASTRLHIARALEVLSTKRELRPQKKHGLIPL